MRTEHSFDLVHNNTMHLHCIAEKVVFPERVQDLLEVVSSSEDFLILAGGSNVILPKRLRQTVVLLSSMPTDILVDGTTVVCPAAVRIQTLIRHTQRYGLGGFEYLFSVPCTIGGAVYMNAGRGEAFHQSISDFITSVECYNVKTRRIENLSREECQFSHRHSIFQTGERVILSVVLNMKVSDGSEVDERIQSRLSFSSKYLDASKPNSGSIFSHCDLGVMANLCGLRIGGACWSSKTLNWISNDNDAKHWQVVALIRVAEILHMLKFRSCKREVILVR